MRSGYLPIASLREITTAKWTYPLPFSAVVVMMVPGSNWPFVLNSLAELFLLEDCFEPIAKLAERSKQEVRLEAKQNARR